VEPGTFRLAAPWCVSVCGCSVCCCWDAGVGGFSHRWARSGQHDLSCPGACASSSAAGGRESLIVGGGDGLWVNGGIEERIRAGPLLGARGGDRFALGLISLARDEGDATAGWRRPPICAHHLHQLLGQGARAAFPRRRRRRPRRVSPGSSAQPTGRALLGRRRRQQRTDRGCGFVAMRASETRRSGDESGRWVDRRVLHA
jgi:hypothetical protein